MSGATATRERSGAPASDTLSVPARESVLAGSLLATVAYYDLLSLPLTAVECWRYLLRPRAASEAVGTPLRQGFAGQGRQWAVGVPALRDVEATLANLAAGGRLETRHGFYFFPGRGQLVEERIEKHARSQEKWRRLRRVARWLRAVPFLRGVAGTGSLAFENARPTSDLDVLIIAAPNRVWTVRFFLTVLLDLFRLRRRPHGETRDRVCLNHYLAEDALEFPYRSLYTAMEYARLVPVLGEGVCQKFRAANRAWIERYLVRVFPDTLTHQKTVRPPRGLRALQRVLEGVLAGPLGSLLEGVLARLQRARIVRAEATTAPGGRVVATDARAEFHPHSREAPLLAAFNERMVALGLADRFGAQQDSGLSA